MTESRAHVSMHRPLRAALSALALVLVTVILGGVLGALTQAQFKEVRQSWLDYSTGTERKGILISEVRALLGYGGLIHNYKNFVLRQEDRYLGETQRQLVEFDEVLSRFRALDLSGDEEAALSAIERTIAEYNANLPLAIRAADEGWSAERTDAQVRVDDSQAIAGLAQLERIWSELQASSTRRLLAAVGQGQQLIWIGFLSIAALVMAALLVGWLLILLFRDLRHAVADLANELSERKRLEASEGRLATAVEQSPATIIITDTNAQIQYVNAKFTQLTGWTLDDVRGQTPAFLQSGDTEDSVYRDIRAGLSNGEAWHGIFRNRKKDGSSYWAETTILPLLSPEGSIQNFIGISEDITEKRQARDQVVRAQKLEAVGQLAGGVAHDFNNILTTIVGSAHLASLDASEGSDLAGEIAQINIAARRAQSLVNELLTFARREPGDMRAVDLGQIIEEVTGLLKASTPPMITIRFDPEGARHFVRGDPTHLHQIVMNLCRNAAEALEGSQGNIELKLSAAAPPANAAPRTEGWVRLTVRDDGPGMSAETQRHLFEPFFTTKPLGKSSGLGLSVVYGLVNEMGGEISFASDLGAGSTFTIILPGAEAAEETIASRDGAIPRGTERILLVDDEAEVLGTFRRLLTRLGYRVEAFNSPMTALERFKADPARFDILISDMVMPDMSGEDLVRAVRDLRDEIPVIYCSAYKPRRVTVPGPAPILIDKPVQPAKLAQEIRTLLD
ncbi:ATP-binding protein [uncultured Roseobacter sp.]|uniref:hybrid sensor histidine kinase/response regulator n=1 Tax=uncultured Roseobacter sp. TaxID=114847 RepID=UPI00262B0335|nr:ATP-binding protein [uncultured Roseobacter sp.]